MGIIPPPSGRIELALSAAERGNAGKRPERPDGGIQHRAVSSTVPTIYNIYAVAHNAINPSYSWS